MRVANAVVSDPSTAVFFADSDDGPFVMVSLLRFKPAAEYADGSDAHRSGREAYDRYAVVVGTLIADFGGSVVYVGVMTGLLLGEVEDLWDAVELIQYPSLDAFRRMILTGDAGGRAPPCGRPRRTTQHPNQAATLMASDDTTVFAHCCANCSSSSLASAGFSLEK